jgi:hypothetical protein
LPATTQSDYASLVDPLFAFGGKRAGELSFILFNTDCMSVSSGIKEHNIIPPRRKTLFPRSEERVVKRSDDRVSNRRYAIL